MSKENATGYDEQMTNARGRPMKNKKPVTML